MVRQLRSRPQYRCQRSVRVCLCGRLAPGHPAVRRGPAHDRHAQSADADLCRLFQRGRLYPRRPVHQLRRARCGFRRTRSLLRRERGHADHRRCHQQGQPATVVAQRLRRIGLYAPGLADRRPPSFPHRRRARRAERRPQHAHLRLGRAGSRGSASRVLPRRCHGRDRPQHVRARGLRLPVELPERPAHPRPVADRQRHAERGGLLRHLSGQRQRQLQWHLEQLSLLCQWRGRGQRHQPWILCPAARTVPRARGGERSCRDAQWRPSHRPGLDRQRHP